MLEIQGLEFQNLVQYVFYGLLTYYALDMARTVKQAKTSIEELNGRVGVVIEKITGHEKSIDEHNERLRYLERTSFLRLKINGGEKDVGN